MPGLIDFVGKTALVTGAAGGIGMAVCRVMAACGGAVVLTDRDAARLEEAHSELAAAFPTASLHTVAGDIGDKEGPDAMFSAALQQAGRIDVLVNNAGVGEPIARTIDQDVDAWQRVFDINLRGVFLTSRAFGRHVLGRRGQGAIVNIASIAGMVGIPASNAYAVSKAGVIHLTRTLASEWTGRGVRVNAISPGYIETSLALGLLAELGVERERMESRLPIRRMGRPEEIASAVAFLASDAASYVSGVTLPVDGGWMGFGGP